MTRVQRAHLPSSAAARRKRRRHLLIPLGMAVIGIVLIAGALFVISGGDNGKDISTQYARAYAVGDYQTMYDLISASDRRSITLERFTELQQEARRTATVTKMRTGLVTEADGQRFRVPVVIQTELFNKLSGSLLLPIVKDGKTNAVDWSTPLAFPGLRQGETLRRTTTLPPRADILANDGTKLVSGASRVPSTDPALSSIVGATGPIPPAQAPAYEAQGVPADATVGTTGLERVFDARLRGTPGGTLYAGTRVLATTEPVPASDVRSTIDPEVQRAAVTALGARIGGIAVIKPTTGAILGLAGSAFSGLQPPGSTFKIVTATAALRYKASRPSTVYPVETAATLDGVELQNANGESCGGTMTESFVQSCNSVFAPLGAKVGAEHLVGTAEAFGFNSELGIPGSATSTIPPATELGTDPLTLGSTAIGQGQVQATALQMSLVAATIANKGLRPELTLASGHTPKLTRVIPRDVARDVSTMMLGVVTRGTGQLAGITGVKVAGKTGTAELRSTQGTCDEDNPPAGGCPVADDASDTTAWFAGYAPAGLARASVAVQLPGQGAGGDTAAPVFRDVMTAALKAN